MKGLELARAFYTEVIGPLISVPHSACLIGEGSEVLGYDTERSTDHEWGPRVQLFVAGRDIEPVRQLIDGRLPETYLGYQTRWFSLATGKVDHHIEVDTTENWLASKLPTIAINDPGPADWLATPQQHLLQLTAGAVFRDDLGVITRIRRTYQWYPDDVWRWMLATQWHLIGNSEAYLGRTIETGDLRGARILTGRLCRLIIELAFLQERRYWPYDKWFGHAFAELDSSRILGSLIDSALTSAPAITADGPLQQALLFLAEGQNGLGVSRPVVPAIIDFPVNVNDAVRPYPVLNSGAIIDALVDAIDVVEIKQLPRVGSIDQLTHADDQLINFTSWPGSMARIYRKLLRGEPADSPCTTCCLS